MTNELVNQVTIVGEEIEHIGPVTVARVSVAAGEGTVITGAGFSRRDPLDKPNRRIGNQLAMAHALVNAGQRLARDANRLVKEADRLALQADRKADAEVNAVPLRNNGISVAKAEVHKRPARKVPARKRAAARAN